jgi:hypothetical protein
MTLLIFILFLLIVFNCQLIYAKTFEKLATNIGDAVLRFYDKIVNCYNDTLILQPDGNLVLYRFDPPPYAVWYTNTHRSMYRSNLTLALQIVSCPGDLSLFSHVCDKRKQIGWKSSFI